MFQEAVIGYLPYAYLDHCPLLLQLEMVDSRYLGRRSFRFQVVWFLHRWFSKFVKDNWKRDIGLVEASANFVLKVKKWNKEVFENIFHQKNRVCSRLEGI